MPQTAAQIDHDAAELGKHLPLKPIDFLIMLALVDRERHGYGILLDVEAATSGDVRLDAGNLYRTLRRLLSQRLVERGERRPAPDADDERRRYYRLSTLGRQVLAAEAKRLEGLLLLEKTQKLVAEHAP